MRSKSLTYLLRPGRLRGRALCALYGRLRILVVANVSARTTLAGVAIVFATGCYERRTQPPSTAANSPSTYTPPLTRNTAC